MYEIFKRLCEERGITTYRFCKDTGINASTISTWKKRNTTCNLKLATTIAEYFGVSVDYVMTGQESDIPALSNVFPIELKRFPMLGEIACGKPKYTNEDRESYIMAGTNINADFCLRASGDSMINARILDGDIVFIRKQDMVENGEIAAVVVNGDEATLKRVFYYQEQALLILRAENPIYEEMRFAGEELNQVHILGKAVAFQSDVR
ncbi:LexA repressor [Blautia hydrogenotrophica]|uniref:helix-turn-helix domain-containing protein n=1 Tax=Blautia hydrogenotrophica TaxID=53443 RepID=UPI0006C0D828|nr:LexA family transcriptional regulator [Blautia hydrogenotrophica]CUM74720.1 LexA repressor [Blautia hydrogenotrophica]SCI31124.1 LexA repressor [uncultured Blautia sp.]